MRNLSEYLEKQLVRGRPYFSKEEALGELHLTPDAFKMAAARLRHKGRLVCPKRGFYLILRPEDQYLGAPDPSRWIEPLMKYLELDYRVSLLRAAAFHGSAHQAAMVFQVIVPKQLPQIRIGRQRVQFLFQEPEAFKNVNRPDWLGQLKTDAGFAKIAGIELTLLDVCRYFHKAAGINGAAQVVHDLGRSANPKILQEAACAFENAAVRRLGYLLERFGHLRQAKSLVRFAEQAKSLKPLDPAVKPIAAALPIRKEKDVKWMLVINTQVEIDT
ncbi:MAG TPA: type IV toxin-antitoxin system AbiEi family antitoxin [Chroococcales cyanobacterium]|nr:type IV toxin-antitoxin system AbiEi family antitoxin [Pirellulales bacterium]